MYAIRLKPIDIVTILCKTSRAQYIVHMKYSLLLLCILTTCCTLQVRGQYEFTGEVDVDQWQGTLYLSLVKDYHKLEGIYSEQIINRTQVMPDGTFRLSGDNLPTEAAIYKIHIDSCPEDEQATSHVFGYCKNNREIPFIAGPKDSLYFPASSNKEIFCSIAAGNERNQALIKIDSLKELVAFDLGSAASSTARELEAKKWIQKIQDFSKDLEEPLAELYAYAFISNRAGELYPYYVNDVPKNTYYTNLATRLEQTYPNAAYTQQYARDLQADTFVTGRETPQESSQLYYILMALCTLSLFLNVYLLSRKKVTQKSSMFVGTLTPQEQKVMQLIKEGKTNKEIAATLFISVSTVKTHINNGYKKLGVSSRDELKLP